MPCAGSTIYFILASLYSRNHSRQRGMVKKIHASFRVWLLTNGPFVPANLSSSFYSVSLENYTNSNMALILRVLFIRIYI